jgi:Zn-dependent metalloprotease
MKKLFFSFLIVLFSTLNFLSQTTAPTLSIIAAPNSQVGWIYFKDPNIADPNTLFTVYASNFGLGADDAMQFVKNETDALGITHTYYEHYYKNTKIDIGHNTVHSRNGKAHLVNGKICIGLNMSVTPAITAASAINYAKNYVNATTYLWEDSIAEQNLRVQKNDVTATYYPNPELLITMIGADLAFVPS